MEETILDDNFTVEKPHGAYGGFWIRFVAVILDGIILSPFSVGLIYFNMMFWKSFPLFVLITIVMGCYKPLMEYRYGATLGKMVLKLKVVNADFGKINLQEAILRDIFTIGGSLVSLVTSFGTYSDPAFLEATGFSDYMSYSQSVQQSYTFVAIYMTIYLVDSIMCGVDSRKRALHDRIAKTYVLQN